MMKPFGCWMSEPRTSRKRRRDRCTTVLIVGESGVGKEQVARVIHMLSPRRDGPFLKVNCAALPEPLLESEMFGYEQGAFTDASTRKLGKFELADGGTIVLDEISAMTPSLQAKLLQVLQDNQFSRLGGREDIRVDVRVLVTTNQQISKAVTEGRFREDLYCRLNVINISSRLSGTARKTFRRWSSTSSTSTAARTRSSWIRTGDLSCDSSPTQCRS
jgi:transcriptional regulator with PAS, ATPase and Fis domain